MTKGIGINIDDEKANLKDGLRDLCQHHYLPFTTKQFDSAEKIIEGFLLTLKDKKVGVIDQPLFSSSAILGIVPGFHLLNDFQNWKHTPINSYQVLANVSKATLNKIFNIQTSWAEQNEGESFSQSVIDRLNSGSRNGRIKIIIKLCTNKDVQVNYIKKEKTIEYLIPKDLHAQWIEKVPKIKFHDGGIITLNMDRSKSFKKPNFPAAKLSNFNGFELAEEEFIKLALEVYPIAVQHFVYINEDTSLLYLFSNNTEIEDKDVGLGGMFLLLKKGVADDLNCPDCRRIINYFSRLTDALSSRLINFYQVQEVKRQSTRAAISQVMARNMSHNIGSHVLNRLVDAESLSKIDVDEFNSYKSDSLEEKDKSPYSQIAIYNNYVKCRMDYLSDVTFGTPVMQTNKRLWADLFKELDKTRLLLEYISGLSENFPYEIRFTNAKYRPLMEDNDFSIALPNDLLGCQAFYNIIENIIRNTAKHNQNKQKGKNGIRQKTVFTIAVKEILLESNVIEELKIENSNFYEVEIFDSLAITGNKVFSNDARGNTLKREYLDRTGVKSETISNIDFLVYSLNEKINESVLGEKNQLRGSSLGLLEMEASAAYLRKLDITKIEEDDYTIEHNNNIYNSKGKLNILKAFKHNNQLGFRFFVNKPTEFLVVSNLDIPPKRRQELSNHGIWLRTEAKFSEDLAKGVVFNHQFILHLETELISKLLNEYKTSLPARKIILDSSSEFINLVSGKISFSKIEECVWNMWFDMNETTYKGINIFTSYDSDDKNHNNKLFYNIAFSNHNETWENNKLDFDCKDQKIMYLEPLSSNSQSKLPNFKTSLAYYTNINRGILTEVVKRKIFESSTAKILVIDERIQRFSDAFYEADGISIPNKTIYEYCNIIMPDSKNIKLDADNYTHELINLINQFIEENLKDCTFLLIHFSILERMYGSKDHRIPQILEEWAKKIRVIVTSGRGRPPELPFQSVSYVNLSPVLNVFIQERSKYSINYLLNSARK